MPTTLIATMASVPSESPTDYQIRRLQPTDRDRLLLYLMPRDPGPLLRLLPIRAALALGKIVHGLAPVLVPGVTLYLVLIISIASRASMRWLWVGISWVGLLGTSITLAMTRREDWHRFCWVVEWQNRFVAYGVLRPYLDYSVLELLQVHPKWARQGIGSALVREMISQCPKPIYVQSAIRVVGFYTGLGFQRINFNDLPLDLQKRYSFRGVASLLVYSNGG